MCPATTTAAPPRLRTAGRLLVVGGALLTVTTHQAQAQARVGFWATLGGGGASTQLSCRVTSCPFPVEFLVDGTAAVGLAQLGLSLGNRFRAGGEFNYWSKATRLSNSAPLIRNSLSNLAVAMSYFPLLRPRVFVRGGIARASLTYAAPGLGTFVGRGRGFFAGVGAEIPVGVNLSVGPMVTYAYSDMPAKPDFGIGEYGWTASVWEFGAAITMHR